MKFLNYLLGYIVVCIDCSGEKFLSKTLKSKISIWGIKKTCEGRLIFCIKSTDLKLLNTFCEGLNISVHILKKCGFRYVLSKYKKRFGIIVGAVIFILCMYISTLYIWDIKVYGCEKTTEEEIIDRLRDSGFSLGVNKNKIDASKIENIFLYKFDKVSWISINIKGTVAYVEIREKTEKPQLIDTEEPCSIYAARDGVIASIESYMGYSLVKPGDAVRAGDEIVTGNYTDKYGNEYKLHSYAKVMANTVRTHTVTIPYEDYEYISTGNATKKYSLKLTRLIIPLYFNKNILYNNYNVTKSENKLSFGDNFIFPLSICKTTYTEVEKIKYYKTKEAALFDAYEQLYDYEYDLVGIIVTSRKYDTIETERDLTVKVTLECYEDIGIPMKIS